MNKNIMILTACLVLFTLLTGPTHAYKIEESSNVCDFDEKVGKDYCETELEFEDFIDLNYYKINLDTLMTLKEAYRNGELIKNEIEFDEFEWDDNKVKIKGWIKPATNNFWGIVGVYNSSWWNSSYTLRFNVTVSSTVSTDEWTLVNLTFPTNNDNFTDNCTDIRIIDEFNASNILEWHFEGYDSSVYGCNQSNTIIWVYVEVWSNNTTSFYVYHNNTDEIDWGNSTTNTCNDWYSIFHLGEGTGSSTYEICTGTTGTITAGVGGWQNQINDGDWESIGHGYSFDGSTTEIDFGDNFDIVGAMTNEMWYIKPQACANTQEPFGKHCSPETSYWTLLGRAGESHQIGDAIGTNSLEWTTTGITNYGGWNSYHSAYDQTNAYHYHNGTYESLDAHITDPQNTACKFYMGYEARWGTYFEGNLTEVRLSIKNRSTNNIKINHDVMRFSEQLIVIGALEQNVTPEPPPPPVIPSANYTWINYYCDGNSSVKNTTTNISNNLIYTLDYTTCDNGCNENNFLIDIWGHDPNYCNPNEFISDSMVLILLVLMFLIVFGINKWFRGRKK